MPAAIRSECQNFHYADIVISNNLESSMTPAKNRIWDWSKWKMQSKINKFIKKYDFIINQCDEQIKHIGERKRVARVAGDTDELQDLLCEGQVVSKRKMCYTQAKIDMEILLMEMEEA